MMRSNHIEQRRIDKGRAWTDEDMVIYRANRSELLNEMLIADRQEAVNLASISHWVAGPR